MEKNELIRTWALKLEERLDSNQAYADIQEVLTNVYDVGFEAGKDAQKLEVQLAGLGKPTPINPSSS